MCTQRYTFQLNSVPNIETTYYYSALDRTNWNLENSGLVESRLHCIYVIELPVIYKINYFCRGI